jgi:hypothetical protein
MESNMIAAITEDHQVRQGIVKSIAVDMVHHVARLQIKNLTNSTPGDSLPLSGRKVLAGLSSLNKGVMALLGAEVMLLAADPDPMPEQLLATARAANGN